MPEEREAQDSSTQQNSEAAAPAAQQETTLELLTVKQAVKDLLPFWPFVLRYGLSTGSTAALTYIIAQKDLELVGAFAAYSSAISLAIGLLYASIFPVVTLMSDAKGAEDDAMNLETPDEAKAAEAREKIRTIWRQGIIFAALLSIPAVIFGTTASPVFKLLKQPDVVVENSRLYLLYSSPGFVADIFYRLTARTVSGLGVRKSILAADAFDNAIELAMAYAFLNGKLGSPELGIAGVGLAYSISKFITLMAHLTYMYTSPQCLNFDYKKYRLFDMSGPFFNKEIFIKLISAGIPDGMSSVLSAIGNMLVVMFCGQSGTAPLVGIQAASVFSGFANFHMSAVLNAACSKIGRYVSILTDEEHEASRETKNIAIQNARMYAGLLMKICVVISSLACSVAFLFSKQLATTLIDENNAAHHNHLASTMTFLKMQGVFEVISGVQAAPNCVLDALLDNRFLFFATTLLELGVNPGAAAATHYGLNKSAEWVFSAAHIGNAMMMMLLLWRCYSKFSAFAEKYSASALSAEDNPTTSLLIPDEAVSRNKTTAERVKQMIWGSTTNKPAANDPTQPLLRSGAVATI